MTYLGNDIDDDQQPVVIVDETVSTEVQSTTGTAQRGPGVPGWLIAVGGLAVVVLVIVATARPSEPPTAPAPTTVPPSATFVPPTTAAPAADSEESAFTRTTPPATLAPLGEYASTIPSDLPGELLTFGPRGRLVVVDRSQPGPYELDSGSTNVLVPTLFADTGEVILGTGNRVLSTADPLVDQPELNLRSAKPRQVLRPIDTGVAIQVAQVGDRQTAGSLNSVGLAPWSVPTGVEVLGGWDDQLLVDTGDQLVLLAGGNRTTEVEAGRVMAFDGRWLVHATCDPANGCVLNVGTPDEPVIRATELPEPLASSPVGEWGSSIAVSADGTRVAVSGAGGAPFPVVVDLETGETRVLGDGMNVDSPMAFSPDGLWLAYAFQTDVTVWQISGDRSWRIALARTVGAIAWR